MLKVNHVAGLALVTGMTMMSSANAGEYQCRIFDSALRIAVEVKKEGHTLPCEVISEDDRDGRVILFSAQYDRDYCPKRLEDKRTQLEESGWVCNRTSETNIVRGTSKTEVASIAVAVSKKPEPLPDGTVTTESRYCRQDDKSRLLKIQVEDVDRGKPCQLIYWAEDDQSDTGHLLWHAEHDAEFCTKRLGFIVDKWEGEGWQCQVGEDGLPDTGDNELQTTALSSPASEEPAPSPSIDAPQASNTISSELLQSVIDADARRISEWMEVEPDIEIAGHGDLDGDGTDDAVVFLAYQSEDLAYRQYLMSYLVTDDTYELAGVKLLTGMSSQPRQAKVQEIDDGVIWLSVPGTEVGQPKPVGYILKDQQLVKIDPSEPAESASN